MFVIEANPRASRTVPFVAKATGATGEGGGTCDGRRNARRFACVRCPARAIREGHVAVKEAVLPFQRFPDVDTVLGPEMRSTGEVMGIDVTFGLAFARSQIAAGEGLPLNGTIFFSLADRDKEQGLEAAKGFVEMGFEIAATEGTAKFWSNMEFESRQSSQNY